MVDINQSQWSETDASNNNASPNGYLSGSMLPSQVEPVGRMVMGAVKRWHDQIGPTVTSGGSANAQTITHTVAHTAYVAGDLFACIIGFTNTGSTTFNVDTLGAKTVKRNGANLVGGELQAGGAALFGYDGTNLQLLAVSSLPAPATLNAAPANPSGTASLTRVMMGVGGTCTITPTRTGTIVLTMHFNFTNSAGASGGTNWHLRYGTGAAPANGAAETGTAALAQSSQAGNTGVATPIAVITGLTVGTAYWLDLSVAAVTSGTSTIGGISAAIWELTR